MKSNSWPAIASECRLSIAREHTLISAMNRIRWPRCSLPASASLLAPTRGRAILTCDCSMNCSTLPSIIRRFHPTRSCAWERFGPPKRWVSPTNTEASRLENRRHWLCCQWLPKQRSRGKRCCDGKGQERRGSAMYQVQHKVLGTKYSDSVRNKALHAI